MIEIELQPGEILDLPRLGSRCCEPVVFGRRRESVLRLLGSERADRSCSHKFFQMKRLTSYLSSTDTFDVEAIGYFGTLHANTCKD